MKFIKGNILYASESYIAQQCNCLTISSFGLSKTFVEHWPWSNAYAHRKKLGNRNLAIESDRDQPGTIKILSNENNDKHIICMFAQWSPSAPLKYTFYPNYEIDTYQQREKWFQECLDKIKELNIREIAFPYKIGCGLANGNWDTYLKMIGDFENISGIQCSIYMI